MRKTTSFLLTIAIALAASLIACLPAQAKRVGIYCYFTGDAASVYADGNIRARLFVTNDAQALVEVENLTDQILYINRGNSFAYVNGESAPMFMPSSNTESHSAISGTVEHVWHNESWISGEAHTSSQTVYDRRILPVAPHGRAVVFVWDDLPRLLRPDLIETHYQGRTALSRKGRFLTFRGEDEQPKQGVVYTLGDNFQKGDYRNYLAEASPLSLAADIQYGFNDPLLPMPQAPRPAPGQILPTDATEDSPTLFRATLSDYVETIAVGSYEGISKQGLLATSAPPMGLGRPCFAFRNGGNGILTASAVGLGAVMVGLAVIGAANTHVSTPDMPF